MTAIFYSYSVLFKKIKIYEKKSFPECRVLLFAKVHFPNQNMETSVSRSPSSENHKCNNKKRDHPKTLYKLNQFSFEAFAEHLLVYKQSKQQ